MQYILALDQGTTSSRALVFNPEGRVCAFAQQEFKQTYPRPGWVEHDPYEIWSTQAGVARQALARAGLSGRDIAAIGITNQRETTLVWDRQTGEPVYNAIVWQDRRTAADCDRLKQEGLEELFRQKTGLLLDAYFSATKVRWILDHVPAARQKAEAGQLAFGTVDTWLIWQLSGGKKHLTEASNASRTLIYNIHSGDWDDQLLDLFDIPRQMLPEIGPSSGICTETTVSDIGTGIPIAGIAGDQQAALFGQGCHQPGMVKNTYGTGCFMLMNSGSKPVLSRHNLLTTVAWRSGEDTAYALEGSVFIAGAVVQWLRDGLGIIKTAAEVEKLAAAVPDSGGIYLVPAFAGLGAPHWDPYARGTLVGITRGTTAAHLARAALESIAYQVTDVLKAMEADTGIGLTELRVDGGATVNNLLLQLQADLLGVPVVRPKVAETTALGAACLAGLAVGYWKDRQDIAAQWQVDRVFEPAMAEKQATTLRAGWNKALERARGWAREK